MKFVQHNVIEQLLTHRVSSKQKSFQKRSQTQGIVLVTGQCLWLTYLPCRQLLQNMHILWANFHDFRDLNRISKLHTIAHHHKLICVEYQHFWEVHQIKVQWIFQLQNCDEARRKQLWAFDAVREMVASDVCAHYRWCLRWRWCTLMICQLLLCALHEMI